jgi:hypothetical protein
VYPLEVLVVGVAHFDAAVTSLESTSTFRYRGLSPSTTP